MEDLADHINLALLRTSDLNSNFKDITLTYYQLFTARVFLGLKSFKRLLLFWDTGSGKTLEVVYIIDNLSLVYPKWFVIILTKASLHQDPWSNTLDKYLDKFNKDDIAVIHYDDPNSYLVLERKIKDINQKTTRILFIIDECHNFISRSIDKFGKTRQTKKTYTIIKNLLDKKSNRIILISATPIINSLSEFGMLTGLLRVNKVFLEENLFYKNKMISKENLIFFLGGCCSYYKLNESKTLENSMGSLDFPEKKIIFKEIFMSEHQSKIYKEYWIEEINNRIVYKIGRRLASTFVYKGVKSKDEEEVRSSLLEFYTEFEKFKFSNEFKINFKNDTLKDYFSKDMNKIKNTEQEYYNTLEQYSMKFLTSCKIILQSEGKCSIYEPFVTFEGINTLIVYLQVFDITFIVFSKNKITLLDQFNSKDNLNGEIIKVILFTKAGSEGITFEGVNDTIILDIPWSDALLRQIIGRSVRYKSHSLLPENRRYNLVHILILIDPKSNNSVDKEMLKVIKNKNNYIEEIYDVFKKSSIENIADTYKVYNNIKSEYIFSQLDNGKVELQNEMNVVENKILTPIYYTDDNYKNTKKGYYNKENKKVYSEEGLYIGILNPLNFEVISNEVIYNLV